MIVKWIADHGKRWVEEESLVREIQRLRSDLELINFAVDPAEAIDMVIDLIQRTEEVNDD